MKGDTDTKIMEEAQEINKIMRQISLQDAKLVLVYAGALHDRSLLDRVDDKKDPESAAG